MIKKLFITTFCLAVYTIPLYLLPALQAKVVWGCFGWIAVVGIGYYLNDEN